MWTLLAVLPSASAADLLVGPTRPYATLADAYAAAAASGDRILLDPGTYTQDLDVTKSVEIVGVGGSEVTTLAGGSGSTMLSVSGAVAVALVGLTLDGEGLVRPLRVQLDAAVTGDDLVFVGGAPPAGSNGGSILVEAGGSLTLTDAVLVDPTDVGTSAEGGQIHVAGTLVADRITVAYGTARSGGGLAVEGDTASATLGDCLFGLNTSTSTSNGGGAVFVDRGALDVSRCTFAGNVTLTVDADGGAIRGTGLGAAITVADSVFDYNYAGDNGAHVYLSADGSTLAITGSQFTNGYAFGDSGAVGVNSGVSASIGSSTFSANGALGQGGAITIGDNVADFAVRDSVFCGNSTDSSDGGALTVVRGGDTSGLVFNNVFVDDDAADDGGGANLEPAAAPGAVLRVHNNDFVASSAADSGAGARIDVVSSTGTLDFRNNVVAFNDPGAFGLHVSGLSGVATAEYNLLSSNAGGDANVALTATNLVGVDPQFSAFTATTCGDDDLLPLPGSPVVDAGDPTMTDLDGSRADIGIHGPVGAQGCPGADTDVDGLAWACDPCPLDAPPDDDDLDGVCDYDDVCPDGDDVLDSDGDLVADGCDACPADDPDDSDGDGVCESADACAGADDAQDGDVDGNPDACDPCPLDALDDSDGDGVCDSSDACRGADDAVDPDGDGTPSGCDPCPLDAPDDTDADGVCDSADLCPGADDAADADTDGQPDGCDPCPADPLDDSDGDGVCDSADACAGGDDGIDPDGDGVASACDPCPADAPDDSDGDGVCDSVDACPGADDAVDPDGDLVPSGCDPCPNDAPDDTDGDGVCDSVDLCPGDDALDADADGTPDDCDRCPGADDRADADGDGVPNGCDPDWPGKTADTGDTADTADTGDLASTADTGSETPGDTGGTDTGGPAPTTDAPGSASVVEPESEPPPFFFCGCRTGATGGVPWLAVAALLVAARRQSRGPPGRT